MLIILLAGFLQVSMGDRIFVGQTCLNHTYCNRIGPEPLDHTYCKAKECLCIGPWYGEIGDTICVQAVLGDDCSTKKDKVAFCLTASKNAICMGTPEVCTCKPGYRETKSSEGEAICLPIGIGTPCNETAYCQEGFSDGLCDLQTGRCKCQDEHVCIPGPPHCAPESYVEECDTCRKTNGACVDLDQDDVPDGCYCTKSRGTSALNAKAAIAIGCNIGLGQVGDYCEAAGDVICTVPHSECAHSGDLDNSYLCKCKEGYSPISVKEDPSLSHCYRTLTSHRDANCGTCIDNGGVCYDIEEDNVRDGCVCPATRTTSDIHDPEKACDIVHVTAVCKSVTMIVCYFPHNTTKYPNMNTRLEEGVSLLYIEEHMKKDVCRFEQKLETGEWCLTLNIDNDKAAECGTTIAYPTPTTISYTNFAILQFSAENGRDDIDSTFHMFCEYDTEVKAFTSSGAMVLGLGAQGSEGEEIHPDLVMNIYDKFLEDATFKGVRMGEPVMIEIAMLDNKDVYNSIKPDVCLASNRPSLAHPRTKTALLIFEGCPVENSFIPLAQTFQPDPLDPEISRTGFFPIFTFANSPGFVFFHCAVRVCRFLGNCRPANCSVTERQKRAIAMETVLSRGRRATGRSTMLQNLESGPIKIAQGKDRGDMNMVVRKGAEKDSSIQTPLLIGLNGGFIVLIIIIGGVLIMKRKKTSTDKKAQQSETERLRLNRPAFY